MALAVRTPPAHALASTASTHRCTSRSWGFVALSEIQPTYEMSVLGSVAASTPPEKLAWSSSTMVGPDGPAGTAADVSTYDAAVNDTASARPRLRR